MSETGGDRMLCSAGSGMLMGYRKRSTAFLAIMVNLFAQNG